MKIGDREVGGDAPCFCVAEIGINHNGSVETAKEMIRAAKAAGADAVKFQKRTVEVVYSPEELARPRESQFGKTNSDLKYGLEFDRGGYLAIEEECQSLRMPWFVSAWDWRSVQFFQEYGFDVAAWKIPSALVTDIELIKKVSQAAHSRAGVREEVLPIIISTGMSTEDEIHRALLAAHPSIFPSPVALLACTAAYPAEPEDLNLRRILTLQRRYPAATIGWSGHEVGVFTSVAAVALGARIVERHFTLDRSSWGSDQAASLEPHGFAKMVEEIRTLEKALGSGEIRPLACEEAARAKLRRVA